MQTYAYSLFVVFFFIIVKEIPKMIKCINCTVIIVWSTCFFSKQIHVSLPIFRLESSKLQAQKMGAQWLSGRVLGSRPRGRGFEPHRHHCVVVLEQDTFILELSTGSFQEDPSLFN